jgi:hypothetical protein
MITILKNFFFSVLFALMQKGMRSRSMQKKSSLPRMPPAVQAGPRLPLWGLGYFLFTWWDTNM